MKYYLGVDQSFTSTGVTILNENKEIILSTSIPTYPNLLDMHKEYPNQTKKYLLSLVEIGLLDSEFNLTKKKKDLTKKDKELLKTDILFRMNIICDGVDEIIKSYPENSIAKCGIESISFGSKGNTADLGMLLGSVIRTVYSNGIEVIKFTPTEVKRSAGKGNYSKEEMIEAVPQKDLEVIKSNCRINKAGNYLGLDDMVDSYWICKLAMN